MDSPTVSIVVVPQEHPQSTPHLVWQYQFHTFHARLTIFPDIALYAILYLPALLFGAETLDSLNYVGWTAINASC